MYSFYWIKVSFIFILLQANDTLRKAPQLSNFMLEHNASYDGIIVPQSVSPIHTLSDKTMSDKIMSNKGNEVFEGD